MKRSEEKWREVMTCDVSPVAMFCFGISALFCPNTAVRLWWLCRMADFYVSSGSCGTFTPYSQISAKEGARWTICYVSDFLLRRPLKPASISSVLTKCWMRLSSRGSLKFQRVLSHFPFIKCWTKKILREVVQVQVQYQILAFTKLCLVSWHFGTAQPNEAQGIP